MAAYARIYGFQVVDAKSIKGNEDAYTSVGDGRYLTNGDFEMLEEILNNEF